ncbi:hypothetical protein KM043_005900 [Ampulex compressa]|nr:hypothetical protein KM043_005900 [Ampulex compressa]
MLYVQNEYGPSSVRGSFMAEPVKRRNDYDSQRSMESRIDRPSGFGLIQLSLLRHTSSFLKMKSESNSPVGFEPGRIVGAFAKFNPGVSSSSHEENSYQQA